jgi:NADPH-dependent glutamate synthase beta subunit-like oxidoreductase/Na+-translocating ferredoxin:NAD+ oxidoreductase RNF subunit RnfB
MAKQKVLALANKISNRKMTAKNAFTEKDPEYKILEPVVTDDMADVAMHLAFREPRSAAEIAALCGKPEDETSNLLWDLSMVGVSFVNEIDGVDKYWHDSWVPGIMEMMVNNKENVKKYPQIAEAFEEYGRARGPATAGNFPVGIGLMRVIPIEMAIEGESRRASYEEISKYLNESEKFSVSDCSCRTAREAMGEGCGHLKEDMCIQLGHAAEYYVRTGRGRAITRDEAFDIIKRAEENGLVHQIPNTDGSGKTHAICNCCGCSCLALRSAEMYLNPDMVRSNYVSKVDTTKCVGCGECVEGCQVNALRLGQKICTITPVEVPVRKDLPGDTVWTEEHWNVDYRYNRKDVLDSGTSPCKTQCPAHIAIPGYIKLASQGKYKEALELIKHENPFPAVCGRICPKSCESECTRGEVDDPVAIDDIKKFIAEQDMKAEHRFIPTIRHHYGNKIAIVGAGPAGMTCAYFLALDGYKVTVFEKENALGGMLTLGIPSFRLEKEIINSEIEVLREMGVEFAPGVEVGKDITLELLRQLGFEAFYLAIGAQATRKLGIDGEEGEGVLYGVDFLKSINLGKAPKLDGNVVVIGGGNVAVDVARAATRVGAKNVSMVCLESREEMPALDEELEEAAEEGITINNGWGPARILREDEKPDGKVTGIEFIKCLSVFDKEGGFSPSYDENQTTILPADYVLVSVGQGIDWGGLLENCEVKIRPNRTMIVDGFTYQSDQPDVFGGGDSVTGPKFAIDAIAQGKQAAISIHRFVQPGQSLTIGRSKREYHALDKNNLDLAGYDLAKRQVAADKHDIGHVTFQDTRGIFTEEQVRKETERCLSCGATVVDEFLCVGCGVCTTKCKFDAITLERVYDGQGAALPDMKPIVIRHALKRKGKIAIKNMKKKLGIQA